MGKIEFVKNKLIEILNQIGAAARVEVTEENDAFKVVISGEKLNYLIGFRGESLFAIQYLLSQIYFRNYNEWKHIDIDISGYKESRKEKIEDIVRGYIDKVRFLNHDVELPPMNPSERRLVHMFVADYDDIETESIGEGAQRRVVLKKKN